MCFQTLRPDSVHFCSFEIHLGLLRKEDMTGYIQDDPASATKDLSHRSSNLWNKRKNKRTFKKVNEHNKKDERQEKT